jgi:N-acetylglutamate synthase-like GNAT family acetyltransferase
MQTNSDTAEIKIRTELQPGDAGYIIYMHGILYSKEFSYGTGFEIYVAEGLVAFVKNYNAEKERIWICASDGRFAGCLVLADREQAAQLRYFLIDPAFRNRGLGKKLLHLFIAFAKEAGYSSSFLWTTSELPAAAKLYQQFGYKLTEEKTSSFFGKAVTEQRYELHF